MTARTAAFALLVASIAIGCASKPKEVIPRRGEVVAQGAGPLSFRAPAAGLVSVYDVKSNSVINSSAVKEGTVVAVNPQAGNITVTDSDRAGTQIVHTGVNKSHQYELWFIAQRGHLGYETTPPTTRPAAR